MLDQDQRRVANCINGSYAVYAGPGSGKSTTLLYRVGNLHSLGKTLCVTFTNEAAKNLRTRCGKEFPRVDPECFSTLHSLALKFAYKHADAFPFPLSDNPLAVDGAASRAVFEATQNKINYTAFTSWVSLQKRKRISPQQAVFTAEASNEKLDYAIAYKRYQASLKKQGVLDFDDLIYFMVEILESRPDIRAEWQYDYVMMDEAQDACELDWRLLQLITEKHKNFMAVGDAGQCHPPGTLITILDKPANRGKGINSPATFKQVPIECLKDGDEVISWTKQDQRTYASPRKIKVSSRHYDGRIVHIFTASTRVDVTPNHKLWVRYNSKAKGKYILYLMYKDEYGFRVGMSKAVTSSSGFGLTRRMACEKADKGWILKTLDSRQEAEAWEEIYSLKYGLPESVFNADHACVNKTQDLIKLIFSHANPRGGISCLEDHEMSFEFPLVERKEGVSNKSWRGYFLQRADNIRPIAGLLDIPLQGINKSAPITGMICGYYGGNWDSKVYSLDVEKDHTYVANGLVVGNSIYGFRGGLPDHFLSMQDFFPGTQKIYLGNNYRSTKNIVGYVRQAAPYEDISEHFRAVREQEGQELDLTGYSTDYMEAADVVRKVAVYGPESCAVLCRTNLGLRAIEEECLNQEVKYHILGDSGFWEANEIQNVLYYVRCCYMLTDNAVLGALKAPFWPSKYLKKKQVKESIEKIVGNKTMSAYAALTHVPGVSQFKDFIRGLGQYQHQLPAEAISNILRELNAVAYYKEEEGVSPDHNPVANLKELVRVAGRYESLKDFLDFVRKTKYASGKKTGVCLSTIHSAKGKEWPNVFVVAVNEGILPHSKAENIAEEKCCWFTAVSRAEDSLHVSYYGTPSVFLAPFLKVQEKEYENSLQTNETQEEWDSGAIVY